MKLNKKLVSYLIIFLIIFTECAEKSKKYNYSNYIKLKGINNILKLHSTVIINSKKVYFLRNFEVINNYLLLIDPKANEVIKIFDLKSYKFLKSFGRSGQGPSEFIQASQIISDPKDKNIFWIFDISTRKLKKYNITKVLNGKFKPEKIIKILKGYGIPFDLTITPDEKILAVGAFSKGRISIYNMNGNFIGSIGKIPVVMKNRRFGPQHSHGFTGNFTLKNKSKEVFIATRYGAIVEKYNIENGKLVKTYLGPDSFFPEYEIVPVGEYYTMTYTKKTRFGYLDICYNEKLDKLFLLYSGKYHYKNKQPNFGNIIYVLDDIKGKIIEQIILDREVLRIRISEDGSALFGGTSNEILKFELKY